MVTGEVGQMCPVVPIPVVEVQYTVSGCAAVQVLVLEVDGVLEMRQIFAGVTQTLAQVK